MKEISMSKADGTEFTWDRGLEKLYAQMRTAATNYKLVTLINSKVE